MKKSKFMFFLAIFIIMISTIASATELKVINTNSDYNIRNNNIRFTKKIIDYDKEKNEVEIELCIENTKKNEEEIEAVEIVLLLDNSSSMENVENNSTRKNTTYKAATRLVNSIYNNIQGVKLGVVQFSDDNQVLTELTNVKANALNAIEKYKSSKCGTSTGTNKALQLAKSKFSKDCKNKIVVLITDGYPGSGDATKSSLKELEKLDISVLSLIVCNKSNIASIQNVFGTEQNPTAGKVYYVQTDSEIDRMLNELIYMQIVNYIEYPIKNVEIKDVFPTDILEYFDINYVDSPTKGDVTSINGDYFNWTISNLDGEESAFFRYRVKLKKNVDISKIIGKEIETNLNVTIKYKDSSGVQVEEVLQKNPIIKLEESIQISAIVEDTDVIEEEKINVDNIIEETSEEKEFVIVDVTPKEEEKIATPVPSQTNTTIGEKLPQTGDFATTMIIIIAISILLAIKLKLSTKDIYIVKK